jgi:hypothetical protein
VNYETYWDFTKTSVFDAPSTVGFILACLGVFFVFIILVAINQPKEYSSLHHFIIKSSIQILAFFVSLFVFGIFPFHDQLYARYLAGHGFISIFEGKVEEYRAGLGGRPSVIFSVNGRSFDFRFNETISPSFYRVKDMPLKNGSRVRLTYVEPSLDPTWWWIGGRQWVTRFEIAREKTPR